MMCAISTSDLRGTLRFNEPMAKHTSWRVGGPADKFYEPADIDDMAAYLAQLPEDEPVSVIGLGSNVLVRDSGIRGSVICPTGVMNGFDYESDNCLRVEAGVPCAIVAKRLAKAEYNGLEFLAGIPGTVGGALAMNAGAFGGETWEHVQQVETLDRNGQRHVRKPEEYVIGYRSVIGPQPAEREWFVSAWFCLQRVENADSQSRIKELLARRAATQPTGVPSCGSVFRNPDGDHAARLIEVCGLKGTQFGNAQVSTKHANFIINLGDAKAADIERLILHVMNTVKQEQGVQLESEVRIVGDA